MENQKNATRDISEGMKKIDIVPAFSRQTILDRKKLKNDTYLKA
ncbi:hypothetical protein [Enterococcus canintestini]